MMNNLPVMHFGPFAMVGRTRESCYVLIVVLRVEVGRRLNLWFMIFWVMPQSSSQVTSKHSKLLASTPFGFALSFFTTLQQ
jgi:hypothetical protein